ncbi:hypothetical protein [Streptomyces sp. NPDC050287]|uniref:hypothetical protein n=1 Tax=Streptomyces sp. NPDC050287 TaxID=3365608 RepID=UPI00378E72EB
MFYLPPRSPELNDIERIWRSAKYEDDPVRSHTTDAVTTAVDHSLTRQRTRIKGSAANFTKAAQGLSPRSREPELWLTDF